MTDSPTLIWFRQDLRIDDHPALQAALGRGGPIVPVFIMDPEEEDDWPAGAAGRWWLHQSLNSLGKHLERRGCPLVLRRGPALLTLRGLAREVGAGAVYWCRRYEPAAIARDRAVKEALRADGLEVGSFNGSLLFEPWELKTQAGGPFQVFTPFWKTILKRPIPDGPKATPDRLPGPAKPISTLGLNEFRLYPGMPHWAVEMSDFWQPGEAGAMTLLKRFADQAAAQYRTGRDIPADDGTSRLSPHLHWGEISPRTIWHFLTRAFDGAEQGDDAVQAFLREIAWREFAHHLLFHFPQTPAAPLRAAYADFPWRDDAVALRAWQRGQTGYPIVDAGMRQLWRIGWMHNRVRMVVGSFLVKHLLLPWHTGAKWFWDTLVDADLANNTLGWQWIAGCGADAAPYFRIFNPILQGRKFDPEGRYVKQWVPELARLPAAHVHAPWEAPPDVLESSGVLLGKNYPRPIVEHTLARQRALAALAKVTKATA